MQITFCDSVVNILGKNEEILNILNAKSFVKLLLSNKEDKRICSICNSGKDYNDLYKCDRCNRYFHSGCLLLGSDSIHNNTWKCFLCNPKDSNEIINNIEFDKDDNNKLSIWSGIKYFRIACTEIPNSTLVNLDAKEIDTKKKLIEEYNEKVNYFTFVQFKNLQERGDIFLKLLEKLEFNYKYDYIRKHILFHTSYPIPKELYSLLPIVYILYIKIVS